MIIGPDTAHLIRGMRTAPGEVTAAVDPYLDVETTWGTMTVRYEVAP